MALRLCVLAVEDVDEADEVLLLQAVLLLLRRRGRGRDALAAVAVARVLLADDDHAVAQVHVPKGR